MVSKRKRRRKLKKKFKILFMSVPLIAAIVLIIIFGFQLNSVKVVSDLNQFSNAEVKAYLEKKEISNTLFLWFRDKIGKDYTIDLFEDYSVKMNSPFKVTITAYEKKIEGYIKVDKKYYYIDDGGMILKTTSEKISNIPRITGLEYEKPELYQKIKPKDEKALSVLLKVIRSAKEYKFEIKKIDVSKNQEITLYIKKIQVQLGKEANMDKKIQALNDLYDNVIKYEGVLNMKRLSADQSYTLKKTEKTKKSKKTE